MKVDSLNSAILFGLGVGASRLIPVIGVHETREYLRRMFPGGNGLSLELAVEAAIQDGLAMIEDSRRGREILARSYARWG
jgi:hypothetical protein